ncbi:ComEA family DNA-binding protein [Nitrospira sp. Nam74]
MTFQILSRRTVSFSALLLILTVWFGPCSAGELVDLNSATPDQLKNLPGMTEGYIMMIVGARPFQSKEDLVEQKLLPQATYDQMKDQIFVKGGSIKSSPPTAVPISPSSVRPGGESGGRESSEMMSPSAANAARVCIKEERSQERVCGELIW